MRKEEGRFRENARYTVRTIGVNKAPIVAFIVVAVLLILNIVTMKGVIQSWSEMNKTMEVHELLVEEYATLKDKTIDELKIVQANIEDLVAKWESLEELNNEKLKTRRDIVTLEIQAFNTFLFNMQHDREIDTPYNNLRKHLEKVNELRILEG